MPAAATSSSTRQPATSKGASTSRSLRAIRTPFMPRGNRSLRTTTPDPATRTDVSSAYGHRRTAAYRGASWPDRPTWVNMDTGLNTIEFYSGDISGNFANAASPQASGGAQDNGPSSATFNGASMGAVQWQMGLGGDGFYSRIDPVGTGTSLRFWQGNNNAGRTR